MSRINFREITFGNDYRVFTAWTFEHLSLIIVRNWNGSLLVEKGAYREKKNVNADKSVKTTHIRIFLNFINFETNYFQQFISCR